MKKGLQFCGPFFMKSFFRFSGNRMPNQSGRASAGLIVGSGQERIHLIRICEKPEHQLDFLQVTLT